MEKTIRVGNPQPSAPQPATHPVSLRQQHLLIAAEVATPLFGDIQQVLTAFDEALKVLRLARMDDMAFRDAHKTALHMLKTRNPHGDRSVALHDVLLDQGLDDTDRVLSYHCPEGTHTLEISW